MAAGIVPALGDVRAGRGRFPRRRRWGRIVAHPVATVSSIVSPPVSTAKPKSAHVNHVRHLSIADFTHVKSPRAQRDARLSHGVTGHRHDDLTTDTRSVGVNEEHTTMNTTTTDTSAVRTFGVRRRLTLAVAAAAACLAGIAGSDIASAASPAAVPAVTPAIRPAPSVVTASMSVCIQAPYRTSYGTYWGPYGAYPVIVDVSLGGQTRSSTFRTATNGCVTTTGLAVGSGAYYRFRVYARLGQCTYVGQTGWVRPTRAVNYTFPTLYINAVC